MTVGDRLKQARKAAYPPVSAAEFAELLNRRLPGASFSRATVSHMENGRRTIPDDVLRVAAHLFGKPLAWFTEGIAGVEPISVPATIAERRTPFRVEPIPDALLPIVSRDRPSIRRASEPEQPSLDMDDEPDFDSCEP